MGDVADAAGRPAPAGVALLAPGARSRRARQRPHRDRRAALRLPVPRASPSAPPAGVFDALEACGAARWRAGSTGMGTRRVPRRLRLAMILALGLAGRGYFKGDAFVAGAVVAIGGADRDFHVLPGAHDPGPGGAEQRRRISRLPRFFARLFTEKIWGALLHRRRHALRRRLEHAAAGGGVRDRLHRARARVRAGRDAHALPPQEVPARAVGAADHHSALRRRPGTDPALRPLGPCQPAARVDLRHHAQRAGSTACRGCWSPSCSRSRRSRSWCSSASSKASRQRWRKRRRRCAPGRGARSPTCRCR